MVKIEEANIRRHLFKLAICASASVIASAAAAQQAPQNVIMAAPEGAAPPPQDNLIAAPDGANLPPPSANGQAENTLMAAPEGAVLPPPPGGTVQMRPKPEPRVEPAAEGRANVSDEIVVTATKRETNLQNTPLAVSAIGGEELQARGIREFEQYYREVPGVALVDLGPGSKKYVIRGINTELLPNGEPQVQQYLDDVPLSADTPQPDIRLYDLERVEILRGPQGTLYGSGSMGGTVRNISRKPNLDEVDGYVEATGSQTRHAGELNTAIQGAVSIPLVNGVFGLRISGYDEHNAGFIDNVVLGREDNNDLDVWGGRITALLKPSDGFSMQLMYLHQDMKADDLNTVEFDAAAIPAVPPRPGPPGMPPFPGRPAKPATKGKLQSRIPTQQVFSDVVDIVNLTVEADLGFATLLSSANYYERNRVDVLDLPIPGMSLRSPFKGTTLVEEARLTSNGDGPFQWLAGMFYSETDLLTIQQTRMPPGAPPRDDNIVPTKRSNTSLFGEASYRFTPKLTGTLGLRYSRNRNLLVDNPAVDPVESKLTYKLHAAYQVSDDLLLYTLTSSGFRGGGINNFNRDMLIAAGVNPAEVDATPRQYDGEELQNYEIGLKSTLLDGQATLNVAAYRIEYKDLWAHLFYTNSVYGYTANAGAARIDGVEFEGRLRPTDSLELRASGAWIHSRVTDGPDPSQGGPKPTRPGDPLPFSPKWTGSVGADYTVPLSPMAHVVLSADASYTGSSYTSISSLDPNRRRMPDYILANARATFNFGDYSVALFVRNLTDKRAPLTINNISGFDIISVNTPRTVGITAKANF